MIARLSFNTACELGFRGSLDEWQRRQWKQLRGPTDANREINKPGRLRGRRISLRFATPTYEPFHDRDNSCEEVIFHIELPTGCRYS